MVESIGKFWLRLRSMIVSKLQDNKKALTSDMENAIKCKIMSLPNKESAIWKSMWQRLIGYIRYIKINKTVSPVPTVYSDFSDELRTIAVTFKRLTEYNSAVVGEYCDKLLDQFSKPRTKAVTKARATATSTTSIQ